MIVFNADTALHRILIMIWFILQMKRLINKDINFDISISVYLGSLEIIYNDNVKEVLKLECM